MIVNVINLIGSFFSAMLTLAKRNRALTREADIYAPSCSVIPHFVYFLQRMCNGHVGAVWRIQHCAGPSAHPASPVTRLKQICFPAVVCVVNFAILHRHLAGVPDVPSILQLATAEKE
jgi:hypothetical protein